TSKTGDRLRPFQVVHVAASLFSVRDGVEGRANWVPHFCLNRLWSFTYDGSIGAAALACRRRRVRAAGVVASPHLMTVLRYRSRRVRSQPPRLAAASKVLCANASSVAS